MNTRILHTTARLALLLLWLAAGLSALPARAQTPTTPPNLMTYQGYLTDGAGNVLGGTNGTHLYDVVFRIFDQPSAGTELYSEIQTITVNNGYFSALLGLGNAYNSEPHAGVSLSGVFATNATTSSSRYIELVVLGIGPSSVNGGNVTLAPRLQLVAAPFAFQSFSAVNAVNLVNSTGSTFLSQSGNNVNVAGILNGNGTGLTGVAKLAGGNTFNGSQYITNGNVGLGTTAPAERLTIAGVTGFNSGLKLTGPSTAVQVGMALENTSPGGRKFDIFTGSSSGANNDPGLNFYDETSSAYRITLDPNGNLGIGTMHPASMLEVNGTFQADGFATFNGGIRLNNTNGISQSSIGAFSIDSPGYPGGRFTVLANGNVGIGTATPANALTVSGSAYFGGQVGIGTTTPGAGLDVENEVGYSSVTGTYFTRYFGNNTTLASGNIGNQNISIIGGGFIQAYGFLAMSDRRIKDIVGRSDGAGDLGVIQKLQVTDYRMKDRVEKGDGLKKGFIAQEVATVIPEAVTTNTAFIPDIYEIADHFQFNPSVKSLQVTLASPHSIKSGDLVRLITENGPMEKMVSSVADDRTFVVGDVASAPKQVFIYGRQVHDFLSVDYNRIYTTGIGAIQELAKRMAEKDAQMSQLQNQMAEMKTQFAAQQAQMADLKKLVVQFAAASKDSKLSANASSAVALTTASVDR